jgi:dihydroorotase
LKWAEEAGVDPAIALRRVTTIPAAILGVAGGSLAQGANADIAIVDPEREWQVSATALSSRGKNTPFINRLLKGKVSHTIVGGFLIFEDARA